MADDPDDVRRTAREQYIASALDWAQRAADSTADELTRGRAYAASAAQWALADDHLEAHVAFAAAQEYLDRTDSTLDIAACLTDHAVILRKSGDEAAAREGHERALELSAELPESELMQVQVLRRLGIMDRQQKNHVAAEKRYRRALFLAARVQGGDIEAARVRVNLGVLLRARGFHEKARDEYAAALDGFTSIPGTEAERARVHVNLAVLFRHDRDHVAAEKSLRTALALYPAGTPRSAIANVHYVLGNVIRADQERLQEARDEYEQALQLFGPLDGLTRKRANVLGALAKLERLDGRLDIASEHARRAIQMMDDAGVSNAAFGLRHNLALTLEALADLNETPPVGREGLLREALDLTTVAVLDAAHMRTQFETEADRARWTTYHMLPRIDTAFRLATALGDAEIVADMITLSRATGALAVTETTPTGGDDDEADHSPASLQPAPDNEPPEATDPQGGTSFTAGWGAMSDLGLDGLFRRQPLPSLLIPGGRRLLARVRATDEPPVITHS